ncbi:hypothetical protein BpOF4_13960 [Alkalihalophilus pseudofirmus OF4]|uniref:Uncharacterized protein n=1 Tax=Alkalihalophilus pseudofirmus (strain ATCC BAA-2126 / JCM 17055 / OF4) TaxID=398511 RepID=D3FYJ1_ALKPO|nr:hypothetical protein BpOF4_13960 [Alkalihalophilus pseudofirmus OF4]
MSSFDAPLFPARQGAGARQEEKLNWLFRSKEGGALTIRSAFCFVWQSEADDDLANEARQ